MKEDAVKARPGKKSSREGTRSKVLLMRTTRPSLIRGVCANDAASWAEFVEFYEPLLYRYVLARGVPRTDAADVVQETFIKLLGALPKFSYDPERGRFRTWLYQVTMSALIDHVRRKIAHGAVVKKWWMNFGMTLVVGGTPDDDWDKAHQRRALDLAQAEVKAQANPRTWACYEQRFLHGRSYADIGRELDLSANAVCVNAGRILEKVSALAKEKLEELDHE
jgi:RNA polymerase sigma-70 factor (ECF subfamily)